METMSRIDLEDKLLISKENLKAASSIQQDLDQMVYDLGKKTEDAYASVYISDMKTRLFILSSMIAGAYEQIEGMISPQQ